MEKETIIYTFIDSQNLYKGIQNLGWEIDYGKLYVLLTKKYHSKKIYYFIGYSKKNIYLYKKLWHIGYKLVFKPTLTIKKKHGFKMKGNVDGELILTAMKEFSNYDRAIIVSGDGDYYCLIKYLVSKNKLGKIIVPDWNRFSSLLRKYAMYIVDINLHKKDISK